MSNSVWPYGLQPARLLCPWDSPGKNTGVGCPLGDLPNTGTKPVSLTSPALAGGFFTTEPLGIYIYIYIYPGVYIYVCVCVYIYIFWYIFQTIYWITESKVKDSWTWIFEYWAKWSPWSHSVFVKYLLFAGNPDAEGSQGTIHALPAQAPCQERWSTSKVYNRIQGRTSTV